MRSTVVGLPGQGAVNHDIARMTDHDCRGRLQRVDRPAVPIVRTIVNHGRGEPDSIRRGSFSPPAVHRPEGLSRPSAAAGAEITWLTVHGVLSTWSLCAGRPGEVCRY